MYAIAKRLMICMLSATIFSFLLVGFAPNANEAKVDAQQAATSANKKKKSKQPPDMSWTKLQQQFPGAFVTNGSRHKQQVALTFDDAPDPRFTPAILDILAKYNVQATFFVVGTRAAKHPAIVKRMQDEGHVIGNHSYDHAILSTLSPTHYHKQIWQTDSIIKEIVGYSPRFVRPPYGALLPQQVKWGVSEGFTIVNWDVDSEDWRNNPSSDLVMHNIKKTLQPGSIILQHAGGGDGQSLAGTIEALPILIALLHGKGFELVTLPDLLDQNFER